MTSTHRNTRVRILTALCLAVASGAWAQISTINSAVIVPRVFNDIPGANGTYINNYSSSITLGESNVWTTSTTAFADRDEWFFSANGTSPYTFNANDFFVATMTLNVSGTTAKDNEAGFIIPNANGSFPGSDLQFIADAQSGFLGMFGGTGFWNSGISYVAGTTVTLKMIYFFDAANSSDAFQFYVTDGSSTVGSPVEDWAGNLAGDNVGGYYQIQTGGTNAPGVSGQAIFGNISIAAPEPSLLPLLALGLAPLVCLLRRRRA